MLNLPNRLQIFKRSIFIAILTLAIPIAPMLIVGGIAGSALAQAIDIPAILSADLEGPPSFINIQYGHQFKTDVEDGGADMSRDNAFFMGGHRFDVGENTLGHVFRDGDRLVGCVFKVDPLGPGGNLDVSGRSLADMYGNPVSAETVALDVAPTWILDLSPDDPFVRDASTPAKHR